MKRQAGIWDFWASHYDRLWVQTVSLIPTRAALRAQLSGGPHGRLLDMGCGTGQLLGELPAFWGDQPTGCGYTGVDASSAMIAVARRKHPAAHFECADVMSYAAAAESFDTIVCAHAFPYMRAQPAALSRLAGWLRPGGRLLLAQACTESLSDRIVLALVKRTTSPARYLSVAELCAVARPLLGEPREIAQINRLRGVPSIRLVVWEKHAGVAWP